MKNIIDITEKELERFKKEPLFVYEKLDLIYFKVRIRNGEYTIFSSKGREIEPIDSIINSVYKDIETFVITLDTDALYRRFEDITIGFFYCPVNKTKTIAYDNIVPGTFIVSDYYVKDKFLRNDTDFKTIINRTPKVKVIEHDAEVGPYIGKVILDNDFDKFSEPSEIIRMLVKKSYSGNNVENIEGIVLRSGKYSYEVNQIDVNPYIESASKLIYRDSILESFIHTVPDEIRENILESNKTYVEKISELFLEYVNTTNFFKTSWIEPEDLVPPIEGYIGSFDYSKVPIIVSITCKSSELYTNVLRIFLATFRGSPTSNKFKRFNDSDRAILTEILVKSQINIVVD